MKDEQLATKLKQGELKNIQRASKNQCQEPPPAKKFCEFFFCL